jgi:anti-anti-sigma regulatory factor
MKVSVEKDIIRVTDLRQLDENQAAELAAEVHDALTGRIRAVEFDLSQLRAIDCGVVDRLLAIQETAPRADAFIWRLVNPPPDVRQLLELVRLHRVFEITPPRIPEMAVL